MTPILNITHRLLVTIVLILFFWWSACWLFTGVYFDRETAIALKSETVQAENFVANLAQGFDHIIRVRMGIPNLLARDPVYKTVLQNIGPVADGAALPYAERQLLWTRDSVLALASQQLKTVTDELQLTAVALVDAAGNCVAVSNAGTELSWVGVNYSDREYFSEILAGRSGYRLNVGKQYGEAGIIFFTPIMNQGKVLGAVIAKANLASYSNWLAGADAFVTDRNGVILLARDPALQVLTTTDAPVYRLDAVKRGILYRQSVFSSMNIAPWGDPRYPDLHRVESREFPIIQRSQSITVGPEPVVHVLWPFPQLITFATQRKLTAIGSGIVGTALLLLVFIIITRQRSLTEQVEKKERDATILNQTLLELHTQKALHDTIEKAIADAGMQVMLIENERIIHVGNRELAHRLGWSDAELDAHPSMFTIIHPDDQQRVADNHRRRLAGEAAPSHYELGLVSRSGERFEFDATVTSVPDSNPPCVVTISRDIGERKRAERDLLLLRRAIDQSVEAYFLLDEHLCFIDVNTAACKALGYSREELLSMTPLEIDPDLTPAMFAGFKAMRSGVTTTMTSRHRTKDGNIFPIDISIAHFIEGGLHYAIALVRNITERKRMENMLLEQNLFLDSLLNAIPVPIFYKDKDARYKGFNKAFEDFYGKDKESLLGKGVFDLYHREQAQIFFNADAELFRTGGTQVYEAQLCDVRGNNHTVMFHKALYYDKAGEVIGQIGAILEITEQRAMQLAIDKERATLRAFFDALPALAWMKDKEGRYLACNPQFERFCGIDEATLRGKTDFDFFDADLALFFQKQDRKAAAASHPSTNEEWVTFAHDGRCVLLETVKAPVFDANGALIGIIGVSHDITERKQVEQRLKEALALSEGIINAIPDTLFEMDRDGRYLNVWTQDRNTLAAPREALLGKTVFEILSPEAAGLAMAGIREAQINGISYGQNIPIVHPNGEERWYEHSIAKKQGRLYGEDTFIVLSRDVTERKRTKESPRNHQEWLDNVFLLFPLGIVLTAMDGKCLEFNHAFCEICGYSADELKMLNYWALTPEEYTIQEAEQLDSLAKNRRYGPYEKTYRQKNGKLIPIRLNGILVTSDDGKDYIWSIVEDITQQKDNEIRLHQSRDLLRALAAQHDAEHEAERREIARKVHEELAQNLSVLRMALTLPGGHMPNKAQLVAMRQLIDQSICHIRDMVAMLRPTVLNLGISAAVRWITEDFQHGVGLKFKLDIEENILLDEDISIFLFRATQELLINVALHADATLVQLSLACNDDGCCLTIRDDGCGFDAAVPREEGTLGLAGLAEQALRHGGKIRIETLKNCGTMVEICLPM